MAEIDIERELVKLLYAVSETRNEYSNKVVDANTLIDNNGSLTTEKGCELYELLDKWLESFLLLRREVLAASRTTDLSEFRNTYENEISKEGELMTPYNLNNYAQDIANYVVLNEDECDELLKNAERVTEMLSNSFAVWAFCNHYDEVNLLPYIIPSIAEHFDLQIIKLKTFKEKARKIEGMSKEVEYYCGGYVDPHYKDTINLNTLHVCPPEETLSVIVHEPNHLKQIHHMDKMDKGERLSYYDTMIALSAKWGIYKTEQTYDARNSLFEVESYFYSNYVRDNLPNKLELRRELLFPNNFDKKKYDEKAKKDPKKLANMLNTRPYLPDPYFIFYAIKAKHKDLGQHIYLGEERGQDIIVDDIAKLKDALYLSEILQDSPGVIILKYVDTRYHSMDDKVHNEVLNLFKTLAKSKNKEIADCARDLCADTEKTDMKLL
ncbi:MAG: hypothetical protein FWF23_04145 [Alphaproteobacteria bacterium]|nr:hypothetical protein [Alphaproteobacteria bacterium]MCL2505428.1 hypothetical protein [Alphaproteobacteria bacterium]